MSENIDRAPADAAALAALGALSNIVEVAGRRMHALEKGLVAVKAASAKLAVEKDQPTTSAADLIASSSDSLKKAAELIGVVPIGGSVGNAVDEWKECRSTIDRCDKLLVDLRKTAFGFVTAIVAAASYVLKDADFGTKHAIVWMLVVLINVMYVIDLAHQSWLGVAVERAKELEDDPLGFELTNRIGTNFAAARAEQIGLGLYLILLFSVCAMFLFSISLAADNVVLSGHRVPIYLAFCVGTLSTLSIFFSNRMKPCPRNGNIAGGIAALILVVSILGRIFKC